MTGAGGSLIGRDELERIIRRAAELQAGERDIGEGLTRAELLSLGQDVGIPARYLNQALLEEQTRAPVARARGPLSWLAGAAQLTSARVVPGERATVERALERWMDESELLRVRRRYAELITWEPKSGALASIQRALGSGRYALARAAEIGAQTAQLEPGFCHVRLTADVANQRRSRLGGAAALLGLGGLTTAILAATGFVGAFAALPVAVLGIAAVAVARGQHRHNQRTLLGLEQVLDRLERGEIRAEHAMPGPRPSTFVRIADEIRRVLEV
ncbi:MAG: hypothetical protein ACREMV_13665 [Gemmatimonadales bacterium]